jgi:hypothetical protein
MARFINILLLQPKIIHDCLNLPYIYIYLSITTDDRNSINCRQVDTVTVRFIVKQVDVYQILNGGNMPVCD